MAKLDTEKLHPSGKEPTRLLERLATKLRQEIKGLVAAVVLLKGSDVPQKIRYLWTSEELLAPEVGAVEIGLLETGQFSAVVAKMLQEAAKKGVHRPCMIVDLIFVKGMRSQPGSLGQPTLIDECSWEPFVRDVPVYCGTNIPKVYMVDGDKFTASI